MSKLCVDIAGSTGIGNVATYNCNGMLDQQMIICGDGTIRNQQANACLTVVRNNVNSQVCAINPGANQLWTLTNLKSFTDNGGIEQTSFEIISKSNNNCLDVANYNGSGNIGNVPCETKDDQRFYIRDRGSLIDSGTMVNQKSGLCLDVAGTNGTGNISMFDCQSEARDQVWKYYQNGELVNALSGYCLDVAGYTGNGNIATYFCQDSTDQMWNRPDEYESDGFYAYVNKKSNKCIDVAQYDGRGAVSTYNCENQQDQRFQFTNENDTFYNWTSPNVEWVEVHCNDDGAVSETITNTLTTTECPTPGLKTSV